MEQIFLVHGILKETVMVIIMSFNSVALVLQGDLSPPFSFIFCTYFEIRSSIDQKKKKNGFILKNARRQYSTKNTDTDFVDGLAEYPSNTQ